MQVNVQQKEQYVLFTFCFASFRINCGPQIKKWFGVIKKQNYKQVVERTGEIILNVSHPHRGEQPPGKWCVLLACF